MLRPLAKEGIGLIVPPIESVVQNVCMCVNMVTPKMRIQRGSVC